MRILFLMYRHVFVFTTVLDAIRREVRKVGLFRETGGALLGYQSEDNALVVSHASGPGPHSELKACSVLIDGEFTTAFANRIHGETLGKVDYVGDWHRHPGWSLRHSSADLEAMMTVADSGAILVPFPISIIYRRVPERTVCYVLQDRAFIETNVSMIAPIPI